MSKIAPYGSWDSPITPETFSKGNCKAICEIQATDNGIFWVEQSSSTGKRELYFKGASGERIRWAPEQSVQNCVHEYGGGSFVPCSDGSVVYSTIEGVFEQSTPEATPRQLANANDRMFRFADFSVTASHVFCVNESHQQKDQDPENRLVSIDRLSKDQKVIASGADFYAAPRVSPDGKRIVWMQWNHINMPWDETSIHMAVLNADGTVSNPMKIRDGVGKNVNYYCPSWSPDGQLLVVNDSSNFWNVYQMELEGEVSEKNIYPVDREIGYPLWQFGDRPYAANKNCVIMNAGGRLMLRRGDSVRHIATPGYSIFSHLSITSSDTVYCIASGARKASCILRIETSTSGDNDAITVVRTSLDDSAIEEFDISEPEVVQFLSDGTTVSGYYYAPKSHLFSAPPQTLPPVLLLGHAGPTALAFPSLDLKKQFFTSRGFAVFDVDYRGSTGYGSKFRNALKGNWGIVDTADMVNAAKALISKGLVDEQKICIRGSSAGGYLVLSALLASDVFKAAVSIYGVGDLVGLVKDTHKFEKGYNEALIAKWPEERHIWEERSPVNHIDRLRTPIAFIHGKEDTVVPVEQSIDMHEKLRAKGVTTALMLFENEGHGFRGPEAIRKCTEATYYFLCKALNIEPSVQSELKIDNLPVPKQ